MQGKSNENYDEKGTSQKINQNKGFLSFHRHLTVTTETQEDLAIIKTYPETKKQRVMYATIQWKSACVHILQKENKRMYMTIKKKTAYMCQNTARIRRIRNLDSE
jgi:hypothetical protein